MGRKFKVIVEKGMDGYYIAEVPELPGCYSQAKTIKELMENIKEAIELYLEDETKERYHFMKKFLKQFLKEANF